MKSLLLLWACCLGVIAPMCAQHIPDYAYRHLPADRPVQLDIVEYGQLGSVFRHDTISLRFAQGRAGSGISLLNHWRQDLIRHGDTTGLDYWVVLHDLGVAMAHLGCYGTSIQFLDQVLAMNSHQDPQLERFKKKTYNTKSVVSLYASQVVSALKMQQYSAIESEDYREGLEELDMEGMNLVLSQDTIYYQEAIDYLFIVKEQLLAQRNARNAKGIDAKVQMIELSRELGQMHILWEKEHRVDDARLDGWLGTVLATDFLIVERILPYAMEYLIRVERPAQALAFGKSARQMILHYVETTTAANFEVLPWGLANLTLMEANAHVEAENPRGAIAAIAAGERLTEHVRQRISQRFGGMELTWPPIVEHLLIQQIHMNSLLHPKVADYATAVGVAHAFFRTFDHLFYADLSDASQLWLLRTAVPTFEQALQAGAMAMECSQDINSKRQEFMKALASVDQFKGRMLKARQRTRQRHGLTLSEEDRKRLAEVRAEMAACEAMRIASTTWPDSLRLRIDYLQAAEKRILQQAELSDANISSDNRQFDLMRNYVSKMQSDESALFFFEGISSIYRFWWSRDTFALDVLQKPGWQGRKPVSRAEFARQIQQLSAPWQTAQAYQASANRLRALLWPWQSAASAPRRITIFPDGLLWSVPFDALTYSSSARDFQSLDYLLRHHEIQYWPAFASWAAAQSPREGIAGGEAMYVGPEFSEPTGACDTGAAWAPLHTMREAGARLAQRYAMRSLRGAQATENSLDTAFQSLSVLAIASHSVMDSVDPLASFIALHGSCSDSVLDGRLHAFEVYRRELPLELVMLWGCGTGTGRYARGEGLLSLGRAFLNSGALAVLSSQWHMDEGPTAEIMEKYYAQLAAGEGKAEALRQAKLQFIAQAGPLGAEPRRWAGWNLVGDPSPLHLELNLPRNRSLPIALGSATALALVGLGLLGRRRRALTKS